MTPVANFTSIDQKASDSELELLDSSFLDEHGGVRLLPARQWSDVNPISLTLWCYRHGFYGLPTCELVEFLGNVIDGRTALEIGAGATRLGHHLGIHMTDSGVQCSDWMRQSYRRLGQKATEPGPGVERIDALAAIEKYRPQVVVASWVTRVFHPRFDVEGVSQAFFAGVDEEALHDQVETYIHVGNLGSHGQKTLLARPHKVIQEPWLLSRSVRPDLNAIFWWGEQESNPK